MPPSIRPFRSLLLPVICFLLPILSAKAEVENPVPVRTVAPDVPASFARGGGSGLVTINFMVDEKGSVQEPTVVKSTHDELNEPALTAIKKWRFKPAKKDGVAVAVRVTIPIKFEAE